MGRKPMLRASLEEDHTASHSARNQDRRRVRPARPCSYSRGRSSPQRSTTAGGRSRRIVGTFDGAAPIKLSSQEAQI